MAIKFYFLPVAQSVTQLIVDIKKKQLTKASILNYAKQFFLSTLTLPVNPETIEVTTNSDNKKTNVVKLGQIVIPKGVELSTLTIESFFPGQANFIQDTAAKYLPPYLIRPMSAVFSNFTPEQYFQYFENLQKAEVPVRLIVTECGIDMDVIVESISKKYITCDSDLHYVLNLIEYREFSPTKLKQAVKNTQDIASTVKKVIPSLPNRQKKGLAIGDTVIVNGKYFYDSFGASPTGTFTNFKGKISHIASNKNATNKYHITTMDGGWRGWVKQDQIQGVQ